MCIELAGTQCSVERNLAEDPDDVFFPVVSYINENYVLHPVLPERNDHGYELRRRCHERGLTMPNAISFTESYIKIGLATLTFTPAHFLLFNRDLSIYNTR